MDLLEVYDISSDSWKSPKFSSNPNVISVELNFVYARFIFAFSVAQISIKTKKEGDDEDDG